jgi:hypothetical protein
MNKVLISILVAGTTALALAAQEPRFGVQGGLSIPAGDLTDNAYMGLQVGGHARWNFNHGHGLMARGDVTLYSQNNGVNVTGLGAGADYTYHLERRQIGTYVLAGLSVQNYHSSFSNYSRNDSALGLDLGLGYDLDRHLGLQARYTTHNMNDYTYAALNLDVTYTF